MYVLHHKIYSQQWLEEEQLEKNVSGVVFTVFSRVCEGCIKGVLRNKRASQLDFCLSELET